MSTALRAYGGSRPKRQRPLAGAAPARLTMRSPVAELPNATRFSEEPDFYSPLTLISMVKGMGPLWRRLREATRIEFESGPERGPGDWALVFLAFTISGHANIRTWVERSAKTNLALWRACGFTEVPSYAFIHERLTELEPLAPAFEAAASELIQHARSKDPRVGAHWHVDGTEAATHAVPQHDCEKGDDCDFTRSRKRSRLGLLETSEAASLRHQETDAPADDPRPGAASAPTEVEKVLDDPRGGVRFSCGGHWWYSRDPSAGTRAYTRKGKVLKAWHGFYHQHVFDHFTGGVLTTLVHPADEPEWIAYPRVYERTRGITGADPLAVTVDRGLTVHQVYEFHTRRGVALVGPYRRKNASEPEQAAGTASFDVHGIPHCRHCGKGTDFVRFTAKPRPRITFRCALPEQPGCHKDQTISCAEDWRRLVPLWRTSEAYGALRHSHDNSEGGHQAMRERYRCGGKTKADRPRRIGAAWQQLRASAALLIEWLWICRRQGWIGSSGRKALAVLTSDGGIPRSIWRRRNRLGLVGGSVPLSVLKKPPGPPRLAQPPAPPPAPSPVAPGAPLPF